MVKIDYCRLANLRAGKFLIGFNNISFVELFGNRLLEPILPHRRFSKRNPLIRRDWPIFEVRTVNII